MTTAGSTTGWAAGADAILVDVDIDWISGEQPGLTAATFSTPRGEVRI